MAAAQQSFPFSSDLFVTLNVFLSSDPVSLKEADVRQDTTKQVLEMAQGVSSLFVSCYDFFKLWHVFCMGIL